jgi:poly-gamma-glutamate capsule biosynthesis protein CapA/YwtB (metallophosphatase superfamily)
MAENQTDLAFLDAILPNGAAIKVEVVTTGGAQDVAVLQAFSLESLEKAIAGFAEIAKKTLSNAAPDSMELELGLNLGLEGGKLISMLAHAKSEASLTVRFGWNRQEEISAGNHHGERQSGC